MKKSTKIWLLLTILAVIPAIFLGKYFFAGITPSASGFAITYSPLFWAGLASMLIAVVCAVVLYVLLLKNTRLSTLLFFSIFPLTLAYGGFITYILQAETYSDITSQAVVATFRLSGAQTPNKLLWVLLATLVYLALTLLVILSACKPLRRVERVAEKLGDGRVKTDDIKIGGSRQFQEIEQSLNKINYIYKEKDNKLRITNLEAKKYIPKQFFKFIGKGNVSELELGKEVKKKATTFYCELKPRQEKELTLEENFSYINSYIKIVAPLISRYDGFIDKYLESGILAVFSKGQNAVECANAILRAINVKNKSGNTLLDARLSLHSGEVMFGVVGDEERKVPAIVSGIEDMLKKMQEINNYAGVKILITKQVLDELPDKSNLEYRNLGSLTFEEKRYTLFESLEHYPKNLKEKIKKHKPNFEKGVMLFNDKKYAEAKACFQDVLHYIPSDKPSFMYFNKASEKLSG